MALSFALKLRHASRLMCSLRAPMPVTRIVLKTQRCFSVESAGSMPTLFRHVWFETPELKAMGDDGLFDHIARKIVRRSALGSDRSNLSPWPELIRQTAAGRISGERS